MGLSPEWFLREAIHREIHRSRRYGRPLSLVLLADADPYRDVTALPKLASSIGGALRDVDVAGALGGRIAMLLPETGAPAARHLAERLLTLVRARGEGLDLRAGIASYREDCDYRADDLIYEAEAALLDAQRGERIAIFQAV